MRKKLERSRRNAAGAERMWRIGVLAKVEVEQRALKVIKCETELASARVAQAKGTVAEQESALRLAKPQNKSWKWRKQRSRIHRSRAKSSSKSRDRRA